MLRTIYGGVFFRINQSSQLMRFIMLARLSPWSAQKPRKRSQGVWQLSSSSGKNCLISARFHRQLRRRVLLVRCALFQLEMRRALLPVRLSEFLARLKSAVRTISILRVKRLLSIQRRMGNSKCIRQRSIRLRPSMSLPKRAEFASVMWSASQSVLAEHSAAKSRRRRRSPHTRR